MKEPYELAELTVISFECADILTASPAIGDYDTPFEPA